MAEKKYIEREAFKAEVRRLSTHYLNEWDTLGVIDAVATIPAADVRPVVLGKWEHFGSDVFRCSECGYGILPWNVGVNFCPNCGARMEES